MNAITLQHNRPLRIAGTTRIECVAGRVWLTHTGMAGDVFLRAGDSYALDWPDMVLVEALGAAPSEAQIVLHAAPAIGWRIIAVGAAVLSSMHERMRAVRLTRRRTPLAG
ncbi:MAG: DUF2917 domain-containing protein [Rhodocyclaceae bacterium]|nr:DUF2917 domain-containing protein [Rhodocyclaceae bacterium]